MDETEISYVEIPDTFYEALLEAETINLWARTEAVEAFRLWCQVNKGTSSVEEGLMSCTPDELIEQLQAQEHYTWTDAINCAYGLREKLRARTARAERARAEAAVPAEDPGGGGDGQS